MLLRWPSDTTTGILSDIETKPESEDSLYGNLDSEDSVSSREHNEPEHDNSESNDNDANLHDSSDDISDEKPEDTTAAKSRAAGSGRAEARDVEEAEGLEEVVTGSRRGRGSGRCGGGRARGQTPEELYKWVVVDEGRCGNF